MIFVFTALHYDIDNLYIFFLLKPGDNVIVMKTVANEKYTCVLPENPDSRDEVCKRHPFYF